jgi:ABC-type polysaccharide/polyol phosphate export permease
MENVSVKTGFKISNGWHSMSRWEEVTRFWTLLKALTYRDLRARYARAALGWIWIFLQPLIQIMVFSILRMALGISSGGMSYVVFVGSAIVPWNFISASIINSGAAIFNNASLIKKMSVPREVFLFSNVLTYLADFLMGCLILLGMMLYFHTPITIHLLWFPALVLVAALLALSLAFLLAAIVPFRGDVLLATPYIIQIWFFLTPVFYAPDGITGTWRTLYNMNPAVGIVLGFRNVIGSGLSPDLISLAWSTLFAVILLCITWPFFRHMSRYFADMM